MGSVNPLRGPANDAEALIIARALRLEDFFPEFTGEHCAKLFPRSGVCVYEPGSLMIAQGENGRDLFIVLTGSVTVSRAMGSANAEVATLGPETLLGEMALLRDGQRTASVAAAAGAPARVFRLMHEDMGYILQHNPDLAAHLQALAQQRAS